MTRPHQATKEAKPAVEKLVVRLSAGMRQETLRLLSYDLYRPTLSQYLRGQ